MNAFYLDHDPSVAANMMCDQHVIKMTLETAQILSTVAAIKNGGQVDVLYRPTHKRHPVVRACENDRGYLRWVGLHGMALGREYQARFGKIHASNAVTVAACDILDIYEHPYIAIRQGSIPLCMPTELHGPDPVEAYRDYYVSKAAEWKQRGRPMRYTNANAPEWLCAGMCVEVGCE